MPGPPFLRLHRAGVLTTILAQVDMEKLAEGLQKLDEEALLHVVQLVHEHRSAETYAKNDVESTLAPSTSLPPLLEENPPSSERS